MRADETSSVTVSNNNDIIIIMHYNKCQPLKKMDTGYIVIYIKDENGVPVVTVDKKKWKYFGFLDD